MDGRPHGNEEITEYYHALKKVKQTLKTRYLTCFWFSHGEEQLMNVFCLTAVLYPERPEYTRGIHSCRYYEEC